MSKNDLTELFGDVIFDDGGVEQMVKDGVFFHPYPETYPWLVISQNVNAACQPNDKEKRTFDQKCVPLFMDVATMAQLDRKKPPQKRTLKDYGDFLTLEGTVAGTVRICVNDKGGLTVYTPEEE